jgi:hypothetical protein
VACAEAVLSGATHDTWQSKSGWEQRGWRKLLLERPGEETCWAESQRGKDGAEARRVFVLVRELHAAAVTVGGERSWSSAAVNRSMTLIGAPHLGQYREGGEFVALETCGSACRRWVAPRR